MKRTYHITDTFDDGTTRQMLLDTECIKLQPMADAKEINYICNFDNPKVMARLLTEHKVCEKEIERLRGVVLELIASGNAAIKGDYSDWDSVVPKAEALLNSEGRAGT